MTSVFINEIHYDPTGPDAGAEAIEIAGPAGTDLAGWTIALYNGSDGTQYGTINLSGTIPDQQNGFGTLPFSHSPIQNGFPDGLALCGPGATLVQFLSYEGVFTASGGCADGMMSQDIGVAEMSAPIGTSLQLQGSGTTYEDFAWEGGNVPTDQSIVSSFGQINASQFFICVHPDMIVDELGIRIQDLDTLESDSQNPFVENFRSGITDQFVLLEAGSLEPNVPSADLMLTPDHPIEIEGQEVPVRNLVNERNIRMIQTPEPVQTYTLCFQTRRTVRIHNTRVWQWGKADLDRRLSELGLQLDRENGNFRYA